MFRRTDRKKDARIITGTRLLPGRTAGLFARFLPPSKKLDRGPRKSAAKRSHSWLGTRSEWAIKRPINWPTIPIER